MAETTTPAAPIDRLRDFRVERYQELKFLDKEAELLADAKDRRGFPLSYHTVEKALSAGCGHRLAVRIFT